MRLCRQRRRTGSINCDSTVIGVGLGAARETRRKADEYRTVFVEHPEFFRIDSQGHGSLVWRRQHQKLFDVDTRAEMSRADYNRLTPEQKERVSRTPLEPPEVATLINAAIELHTRAVAQERARRWWVAPLVSLVSAFGGALVGGLIAAGL